MTHTLRFFALLGLLPAFVTVTANASAIAQEYKVEEAMEVLEKITEIPEEGIPSALLGNAYGLAVIPEVIKAGLIIGGSYGRGVLTVRDEKGRWSPPVFIRLIAGSYGWQIGAQSTDIILVFKTPRSVEGIVKGTFKLGADAAVAAGPVGRRGEAATDVEFKAEILSWSRSRGLFAGVSLEGSKLDIDHNANADYYGKAVHPREVLDGQVKVPASTGRFLKAVEKATGL